jgi:hypothetical protein
MLLITSGEYVISELAAEFGRIPPAFLPVGNRRLYAWQIERRAPLHEQVYLTLPADFALDAADQAWLSRQRVRLYRTHPGIPLGAAVHEFLHNADVGGRIDILYGDTLIDEAPPDDSDWIAVGSSDENYDWRVAAPRDGQPGGAWTGMFSFSDAGALRRELERTSDFLAAVERYRGRDGGGLRQHRVERWLDFGHVHTYFDSKRVVTTERHFNHLRMADGVVTKSSADAAKMTAEAIWFEQAPRSVKPYLAAYLGRLEDDDTDPSGGGCSGGGGGRGHGEGGDGDGGGGGASGGKQTGYQLEYLHLAALNELYVFGRLPEAVWARIFGACDAWLRTAAKVPLAQAPAADLARRTYLDKTLERLARYREQSGCALDSGWRLNGRDAPPLLAIADEAADAVMAHATAPSFIHGDLCFSNMLFDFRAGRLKMIDPRGTGMDGLPCCYGDLRYDVGKLAHSVLGLYDHIVAGRYQLEADGQSLSFHLQAERCGAARRLFLSTPLAGRKPADWDCYPVMVLLFLSMLPLHADDARRQQALMANAIRLYLDWKSDDIDTDGRAEPAFS